MFQDSLFKHMEVIMKDFTKKMKREIEELLTCEELEHALFYHFEQFKEVHAEAILRLFPEWRVTSPLISRDMRLVKSRKNKQESESFRFELRRFFVDPEKKIAKWGFWMFKPRPTVEPAALIPQNQRSVMEETPIDPNRMHTLNYECEELGTSLQVTYTRFEKEWIVGRLREIRLKKKNRMAEEPLNHVDIKMKLLKCNDYPSKYQELILYMDKFPKLRVKILNHFFLFQKPLLDREIENLSGGSESG